MIIYNCCLFKKVAAFLLFQIFIPACLNVPIHQYVSNIPQTSSTFNSHPVLYVPGNYSKIQEAIENAVEGTIIYVDEGIYYEYLTIKKTVYLIGVVNKTILFNVNGQVSIKIIANNVVVSGFIVNTSLPASDGIYVFRSNCVVVRDNVIVNHRNGIYLRYSSNNLLENNLVMRNDIGIHIYDSTNNTLRSNIMIKNMINIRIWGSPLSHFRHSIDETNKVDGKSVYYLVDQQDRVIAGDVGFVGLVNCSNIVVRDVNIKNNFAGVLLVYTNNCIISNSTFIENERGIYLLSSHKNVISNNVVESNQWSGFSLIASTNNSISSNTIYNNRYGLYFSVGTYISREQTLTSKFNIVESNIIVENIYGLFLDNATCNVFRYNFFENNSLAIYLVYSNTNMFEGNNLRFSKQAAVKIENANGNCFYHNNFVKNNVQVICHSECINMWDNGYPVGGNYWDTNPELVDFYNGAMQDMVGSDGICDKPFIVEESCKNTDNYPLAAPLMSFKLVLDGTLHYINIISNSIVLFFHCDFTYGVLFNLTVKSNLDASNFCKIIIPKRVLNNSYKYELAILVDGANISKVFRLEDEQFMYLYVTFNGSFKMQNILIHVISEFKFESLAPSCYLLLTLTLIFLIKRKILGFLNIKNYSSSRGLKRIVALTLYTLNMSYRAHLSKSVQSRKENNSR